MTRSSSTTDALLLIDQEVSETLADTTIDVEEHADGVHFVVRR